MLRVYSSKLTRSTFLSQQTLSVSQTFPIGYTNKGKKTNYFYHQSIFKIQTTMSSSKALDSLNSLMAKIDEFELEFAKKRQQTGQIQQQPQQPQEQKYQYQSQSNPSSNQSFPTSNKPVDVAFRPKLPVGHTMYSWLYTNTEPQINDPQPKPTQKSKQKQKQQQKQQKQQKQKQKQNKQKKPQHKSNKRRIELTKGGSKKKNGGGDEEKVSFERRDHLLSIEKDIQKLWDKNKVFEANVDNSRDKFMCTFPYPYMNGYLHLGHAFTITKAEFRAGYERLKGKNVLFPFAFHCTGMPIAAAAKRIEEEMLNYGNPPQFPTNNDDQSGGTGTSKHSKLQSKSSGKKYQWEIMREFDLNDGDIGKFSNPLEWLSYFPPIGIKHLKDFGLKVDWRRSFITTDANPYYNKFIEWQFMKLKKGNFIEFGNRPSIFSPKENQPCADHDRSEGENVIPQQYTLIKMELTDIGIETPFIKINGDKLNKLYKMNKKIFMVAATLRPETMYGQTNCFILPRGEYIAIEMKNNEIFICSEHSARNMSYQEMTPQNGKYNVLCEIEGWDLLGRALKAPNAVYDKVYVLPLSTIKMDKGTGIVTSVPADAPADYAALKDAQTDADFRTKYYLTDEMVLPYDVVEIIKIDKFNSTKSAVDLCEQYKVKSQNDVVKLDEIKDLVYKYGFATGVMLVGDFKGEKVSIAKDKCQRQLIKKNLATIYWEPENNVLSRTGCKCVVAFCDQWFLKYGIQDHDNDDHKDNLWHKSVKKHIINDLECYNSKTKDQFIHVIDWLHSWACSREFGLGTKLPWDNNWIIESLSDSTIYMSFYTIAHHLLNGTLDGDYKNNSIDPNDLTYDVFDVIYCNGDINQLDLSKSTLTQDLILKMKNEFEYFYPMDLRVSGKDLIFNHLTMALYNHAAIWPNQSSTRWPRSYFTNGWALLDSDKMSKSSGNFLTLDQSVCGFGADATRFALANAGDTLEDANFESDVANAAILQLTRFEDWVFETYQTLNVNNNDKYRDGDYSLMDKLFDNAINRCINETENAYNSMKYRDVLRFGFHILRRQSDYYLAHIDNGINRKLIQRYIDVQLILLSPICPHITEYIWGKIHNLNNLCVNASWPKLTAIEDLVLTLQYESLQKIAHDFRNSYNSAEKDRRRKLNKAKKGSDQYNKLLNSVNGAIVCIADDYKNYHKIVLKLLLNIYDENTNSLTEDNWKLYLLNNIGVGGNNNDNNNQQNQPNQPKKKKKKNKLTKEQQEQLKFASYLIKEILPDRKKDTFNQSLPYNEYQFLSSNKKLLFHEVDIDLNKVRFYKESDNNTPQYIRERTNVGDPAIKFLYVD